MVGSGPPPGAFEGNRGSRAGQGWNPVKEREAKQKVLTFNSFSSLSSDYRWGRSWAFWCPLGSVALQHPLRPLISPPVPAETRHWPFYIC